jgi:hypothetical protein
MPAGVGVRLAQQGLFHRNVDPLGTGPNARPALLGSAGQGWDRGVRTPSPPACRLLDIISKDPAAWIARLRPAGKPSPRSRWVG